MKNWFLLFSLLSCSAQAETQQKILDSLVAQAGPASATRGETLFRGKFSSGKAADSCTSCHTDNAKTVGQHIKTQKAIDPLAPVAQKDRFTDAAKVEKWFKRNCQEVLGRACTAQEKADFTAYMISLK
jgi:cytochrome c551/c552